MRFGVALIPSKPLDEFIQTVQLAEELGFDSVWVLDACLYRDVHVSLTLAALNTTRVRLGTSVTKPYTRHPGLTAVGIASVDTLSRGRAILGLGAGGIVLTKLQIEQRHSVEACRIAIENIRRHLGGNPVRGNDKPITADSNVQLDFPTRADLPMFIAATGRKMLTLAGELADGVIINVGANPACIEAALAAVEAGVSSVHRRHETLERLCWLQGCVVSEDGTSALNAIKPTAALTLGYGPDWIIGAMGFDQRYVQKIRKIYSLEGPLAAAKLITDEMAEQYTIAGTPRQVISKLKRLETQGFDEIIFLVEGFDGNRSDAMRTLVEKVIGKLKG